MGDAPASTDKAQEWWARLRRGLGIVDLLPDDLVRQALVRRLAVVLESFYDPEREMAANLVLTKTLELIAGEPSVTHNGILDCLLPPELAPYVGEPPVASSDWTPARRVMVETNLGAHRNEAAQAEIMAAAQILLDGLRDGAMSEQRQRWS